MFKPWEKMLYDTVSDGGASGGLGGAAAVGEGAAVSGTGGSPVGDNGSAIGASGTVPPSWLESLPEDIRKDPSIQLFKESGPAGLAKSWVHAQKTMGKDKIILPGEGATEEDWNTIYQKLGRPEAPDKYEIKMPDGKTFDKDFASGFKGVAFKAGLSPRQLNSLAEWYHGAADGVMQAAETTKTNQMRDAIEGYKQKLGGEEKYQANISKAQVATRALLNADQAKLLKDTGMDTHPAMIDLFANLSGMMSEDKIRDGTGVAHGESVDTLNREIEQIEAKLFSDMNSPNKETWMAQREKLYNRRAMAMGQQ